MSRSVYLIKIRTNTLTFHVLVQEHKPTLNQTHLLWRDSNSMQHEDRTSKTRAVSLSQCRKQLRGHWSRSR